ncbi:acyl-CoA/acyl-ACP dehydrogenase [Pararhizobium sp. YC-54]|uniref:acyl-CoA dehydrogenase family protein n=1 Tax=Pararhizobium sp. YC-54 TaxID=2986920 RepID=UPI0021F6A45E|nr:acyl-CoA dehydrogenase family protein [Pararhizobium sp. YC-54]MCW0001575.1 acyl-CoA/acyl-ACP dehydrogenase [Pararhizobium sp. YC-54]
MQTNSVEIQNESVAAEDIELVRDAARAFVSEEIPTKVVRAAERGDWTDARNIWTQIGGLGWLDLLHTDSYGLAGLPIACAVAEELGRRAFPISYPEVAGLIIPLLSEKAGSGEQFGLLQKVRTGELLPSLAMPADGIPQRREDLPALVDGKFDRPVIAYTLQQAEILLVPFQKGDAIAIGMITKPAAGWPGAAMPDMANSAGVLLDALSGAMAVIDEITWTEFSFALERLRLMTASYVVGLSAEALALAVQYAKEREAFGKLIGSFQAVQQRLADSELEVAGARLVCIEAAYGVDPTFVAMACLQTFEAAKKATFTAQQIWAGMGYTLEVDVQLYFRRARAFQLLLGRSWELKHRIWQAVRAA